jgi:hypothetical protein
LPGSVSGWAVAAVEWARRLTWVLDLTPKATSRLVGREVLSFLIRLGMLMSLRRRNWLIIAAAGLSAAAAPAEAGVLPPCCKAERGSEERVNVGPARDRSFQAAAEVSIGFVVGLLSAIGIWLTATDRSTGRLGVDLRPRRYINEDEELMPIRQPTVAREAPQAHVYETA